MNILYLENHAIFAQQVTQLFLKSHQVTVIPSLVAARQAFSSGTIDLVLADYDLDDGKGDEFVREWRVTHPHFSKENVFTRMIANWLTKRPVLTG